MKDAEFKQDMHFPPNKQVVELSDESQQVRAAINFVLNYTIT